ncbi:AbrB/MazE/SpoVT family DNA-binding domain-containing protein [Archaeoglobus sp.]
MELTVLKTNASLCLLIPKMLANELGWQQGDLLEFVPRANVIELRNLGEGVLIRIPYRRGLRKFGGSYAVTIPPEIKERFVGLESVKVEVEDGRLFLLMGGDSGGEDIRFE